MANQRNDDQQASSMGSKAKDLVKMAAKRIIRRIMREIAKQVFQAIVKAFAKALIWIVATVGVPALIVILCCILFAGAAIYVGRSFDWITDESVDKTQLAARYETASASTAVEVEYRFPKWLIQDIDNILILKMGRVPKDINPENLVKGMEAIKKTESKKSSYETSSYYNGKETSFNLTTQNQVLVTDVKTWNRHITYTYILMTDYYYYGNSDSEEFFRRKTNILDRQDKTILPSGGTLTKYTYRINDDIKRTPKPYIKDQMSYSVNEVESTQKWLISVVEETPDFEQFDKILQSNNFTKTDFSYLEDAIKFDDPNLTSIKGYSPDNLLEESIFGKVSDGTDIVGGKFPDSPNISSSSEWGFPTNIDSRIGSPYGWRFDDTKGKYALHKGQDISRSNKNIDYINYAVAPGKVVASGDTGDGYGNKVVIDHGNIDADGKDVKTLYAHMVKGSLQVSIGDQVFKGKSLGIMGQTGLADGVHLHFEVRINDEPVNPIGYLRR